MKPRVVRVGNPANREANVIILLDSQVTTDEFQADLEAVVGVDPGAKVWFVGPVMLANPVLVARLAQRCKQLGHTVSARIPRNELFEQTTLAGLGVIDNIEESDNP